MSDTDNTGRIRLGKKDYIEESKVIYNTESKTEDFALPTNVISRKILADKNNTVVYIRVDFERKKKKEAYRKINKILGEN